ncbi:MAG TPA: hypothetical protein VKD91_05340 [Pyrinomonadaceae bacterium]|nr:hypothetical protein [Pyrinomonadaceae bacterium]
MEGTLHVLAHNGLLPQYQASPDAKTISPRRKGVKQGVLLMLIGVLLVPIFGVMSGFAPPRLENFFAFWAALTAIICFVGGPLRMLFAAIFEEGAPKYQLTMPPTYKPTSIPPASRVTALPPPSVNTAPEWRQRPQTAEIMQPPSVTDSTTRLLDKEPKGE